MSDMQFLYLFIAVCVHAFTFIKISFDNRIDMSIVKTDIKYIKRHVGLTENSDAIKHFQDAVKYHEENCKRK